MSIQAMKFGRDVFLDVFGIERSAWTQRTFRGEVALAFGLSRPGHVNSYGELDLFAFVLATVIAFHVKISTEQAAELVRKFWHEWLEGLARTERLPRGAAPLEGDCFVIAANEDKTKIEAKVGPCAETIVAMSKMADADMLTHPMPLDVILRWFRRDIKKAGLNLPKKLTPGLPESPEFKQWIAEIENYRKFALMRGGSARAKKRKEPA